MTKSRKAIVKINFNFSMKRLRERVIRKRKKREIPVVLKPKVGTIENTATKERTLEGIVDEAYQRIEPRLDSVIKGFEDSEIVRFRMAAEVFKARRDLVKQAIRDAINEYVSVGNVRDMKDVLRSMLAVD